MIIYSQVQKPKHLGGNKMKIETTNKKNRANDAGNSDSQLEAKIIEKKIIKTY